MGAPVLYLSSSTLDAQKLRDEARCILDAAGYIVLETQTVELSPEGVSRSDVVHTLRERIKKCDGVVLLLGGLYGPELPREGENAERCSLAETELRLARELHVPCYSYVLSEEFAADERLPEEPEIQELQDRFRAHVTAQDSGWEMVADMPRLGQRVRLISYRLEELREKAAALPAAQFRQSEASMASATTEAGVVSQTPPPLATPPPLPAQTDIPNAPPSVVKASTRGGTAFRTVAIAIFGLLLAGGVAWYVLIHQGRLQAVQAAIAGGSSPRPAATPPSPAAPPTNSEGGATTPPASTPEIAQASAPPSDAQDDHAGLASRLRGETAPLPPVDMKLPPAASSPAPTPAAPAGDSKSSAGDDAAMAAGRGKPTVAPQATQESPPRMNMIGAKPRLKETARKEMSIEQTAMEVAFLVDHMSDPFAPLDAEEGLKEAMKWVALEQGVPFADLREDLLAYAKKVESTFSSSQHALTLAAYLRGDHEAVVKRSLTGDARTNRNSRMLRASSLRQLGRYEEAFKVYAQAASMLEVKKHAGPWCESVYMAARLRAEAAGEEGVKSLREVLEMQEANLGPESARVGTTLRVLASLLSSYGISPAEAEPMLRRAIAIHQEALGKDHPEVARGWRQLGEVLEISDDMKGAREARETAQAIHERCFGPEDVNVADDMHALAKLHRSQEQLDLAETLCRQGLQLMEAARGAEHARIGPFLRTLAEIVLDRRRDSEAEKIMRREMALHRSHGKDGEYRLAAVCNALGKLLDDAGQGPEAEQLLREAVEREEASPIKDSPMMAGYLRDLAAYLVTNNRRQEAADLNARAEAIEEKLDGIHKEMQDEPRKPEIRNSRSAATGSNPSLVPSRSSSGSSPTPSSSDSSSGTFISPSQKRVEALLMPEARPMELPPVTRGATPRAVDAPSLLPHFIGSLIATYQPGESMHDNERFLDATKNVALVHDLNQRALWITVQDYVKGAVQDGDVPAITRAQALVMTRDYRGAVQEADGVLKSPSSTTVEKHQASQVKMVATQFTGDLQATGEAYQAMVALAEPAKATDPLVWCGAALPYAIFEANRERYKESLKLLVQIHTLQEKALGPEHPQAALTCRLKAHALRNLVEIGEAEGGAALGNAESYLRFALEHHQKRLGSRDIEVARDMSELAAVLKLKRPPNLQEVEKLLRDALEIQRAFHGPRHPATATTLLRLANAVVIRGKWSEGTPLYEEALSIREESLGQDHFKLLSILKDFATYRELNGEFAEAIALTQRGMGIRERYLGPDHVRVVADVAKIGLLQVMDKQYTEGERTLRRALALQREVHGENHQTVINTLNNLAQIMKSTKREKEAESLFWEAVSVGKKTPGSDATAPLFGLALLLYTNDRLEEALPLFRETVEQTRKVPGAEENELPSRLYALAWAVNEGEPKGAVEAARLMREALAMESAVYGANSSKVAASRAGLALVLHGDGKNVEAEQEMRDALAVLAASSRKVGEEHPELAKNRKRYAEILKALRLTSEETADRIRRVEEGAKVEELR